MSVILAGTSAADPFAIDDLLRAAKHLGLKAKRSRTTVERLGLTALPALAVMRKDDGALHVVLLAQSDGKRVLFQDIAGTPAGANARPAIEPVEVFATRWTGDLILISSRAATAGALARFDFSWFIPALVKYRRLLGEVLLISFMLQIFGLVSPLFFQVVMDKVLVHKGMTTLDVLVIGLVIVVIFESILNGLRAYVFSHTTSRIDVELGARLFRHLVALPLAYFQARRVGDSVARVRELENIRSFLTGNALTVLLDVFFSVVFIAVMLLYSVPLTLIVLVSLPLYFGLSLAVVPLLRQRLDVKFARGAENQAMLVETVTGIQTVKATALEPAFGKRWDAQLAAYVSASFKTQNLASAAHEGVNLIGKLVNAATLWYGAHLVMNNDLSVGQFVAFNMFAQRVSQPIMRMAQLWTDFQQTGISVARLGDILNTRTEVAPTSAAQLPLLKGRITLDQVTFRYRPEAAPVLGGISLDIKAGEIIGIVGRSGSGKSTFAKLVIKGNAGDNVLDGGAGADTLIGSSGNDTYYVDNAGDITTEAAAAGTDSVISSINWTLAGNLENLTLAGSGNLNATGNSQANVLTGNAADNILDGKAGADTMLGGAGNDSYFVDNAGDVVTENAGEGVDTVQASISYTLADNVENLTLTGTGNLAGTGNALNNWLMGTSGSNILTGNAGNDTLDGGAGTDTLAGGTGDDTYVLGSGYGSDTVQENDGHDVLQLMGASANQIWLRKVSNNLEVSIIGTSDKMTISNWYLGAQYHVEEFKTSDGRTLLDSQVQNLVQAMAGFSPPAAGQTTLPKNYANSLSPVIAANWT